MAREAETRVASRTAEERALDYLTKSELKFQPDFKEYYKNQGYHIGWVRWLEPGTGNQNDTRNLAQKRRQGWSFVRKSELPEEFRELYDTTKIDRTNDVVCVGDLILGKIKSDLRSAQKKHFEDLSNERVRNARRMAKNSTGNSEMDANMPVFDDSKSTVSRR